MSEESTVGGLLAVLIGILTLVVPLVLGLTAAVYFAAVGEGSTAYDVFWWTLRGTAQFGVMLALVPVGYRIYQVYSRLQRSQLTGENLDAHVAVEAFGTVVLVVAGLVWFVALMSGCDGGWDCSAWDYTFVLTDIPLPIASILSASVMLGGMVVMGVGVFLQSMTPADDGDDEVSGYV